MAANTADQAHLREVVETVVTRAGYDLEEMTVVAAGRRRLLRVVIDSDNGVDLDDAAQVSREISAVLDVAEGDADPMGAAAYTLEVTSPGIGRPLTLPRHFRRARGRLLAITGTDGTQILARVLRAGDEQVELLTGKSGLEPLTLRYEAVVRAKVEVEFSAPSAAVLAALGPDTAEKFEQDDLAEGDLEDQDDPIEDDEVDEEDEPDER